MYEWVGPLILSMLIVAILVINDDKTPTHDPGPWIRVEKWDYGPKGDLMLLKEKTYKQKELTGKFEGYYSFECIVD